MSLHTALRPQLMAALAPFRADDGSYRFVNQLICIVARRPGRP